MNLTRALSICNWITNATTLYANPIEMKGSYTKAFLCNSHSFQRKSNRRHCWWIVSSNFNVMSQANGIREIYIYIYTEKANDNMHKQFSIQFFCVCQVGKIRLLFLVYNFTSFVNKTWTIALNELYTNSLPVPILPHRLWIAPKWNLLWV